MLRNKITSTLSKIQRHHQGNTYTVLPELLLWPDLLKWGGHCLGLCPHSFLILQSVLAGKERKKLRTVVLVA